jgi:hypothetical protein
MKKKNLKKKVNTLPTGPHGPPGGQALPLVLVIPVVGRILQKNLKKKNRKKKVNTLPTGPRGPCGGQNLTKKMKKENLKKKANTLSIGPRGPLGGQALPLVPVVPVVGRISPKK